MATRTGKSFQKETNKYAASAIASMRDELDALEHARECDGTAENGKPCKRGSEVRRRKTNDGFRYVQNRYDNPETWHDEDAARRVIEESPLSLQVRGGWCSPGELADSEAEEYELLLGTGGPASRIIGKLDRGQPETAVFQYQDWFKPWTAAQTTTEQDETLLTWVQNFYFGE